MKKRPSKEDIRKARELLEKNPDILFVMLGIVAFKYLASEGPKPSWLKDLMPVNLKHAGPWRGKGSFGKGFGANPVRHK